MAHIVITSGPTRQYLDPVRYLTNASSGRMGAALASAAIKLGHRVTIVSGPVQVTYPKQATVVRVLTTQEMLEAAKQAFQKADGLIGAAAPCDYQPRQVHSQKLSKTGQPLTLELIETPDIVATLASAKRPDQWVVGFALETEDRRFRATVKLQKKSCDLMVSNGPTAIDSNENSVEVIDRDGQVIATIEGSKVRVSNCILRIVQARLIDAE
jgi:phosphopantothenoylcysteine decarboxylase/phosphopantothenate--cysteine ligase